MTDAFMVEYFDEEGARVYWHTVMFPFSIDSKIARSEMVESIINDLETDDLEEEVRVITVRWHSPNKSSVNASTLYSRNYRVSKDGIERI